MSRVPAPALHFLTPQYSGHMWSHNKRLRAEKNLQRFGEDKMWYHFCFNPNIYISLYSVHCNCFLREICFLIFL